MQINGTTLTVVRGSLLDQDVDVIVNAANTRMRGGGGIDGAIHRAAGPGLLQELMQVVPDRVPTGAAVLTRGHNLKQPCIIHTPGPVWGGGSRGEAELLASCYRSSLELAEQQGLTSIGFCSISTGAYRYPLEQAAAIALRTVVEYLQAHPSTSLQRVVFAMYGQAEYDEYARTLAQMEPAA